MTNTETSQWVVDRWTKLKGDRSSWDTLWQDIATYVMPRKADVGTSSTSPSLAKATRLFDSTAVRSNQILANGQLSWMTPLESRWFSFDPPHKLKGVDQVEQWYRLCTEIAIMELAQSNFYTTVHELYLDRGCFGTSVMLAEEGKKNALSFSILTCGTYVISEDSEGEVDTLIRELKLTVRAAAEKFGVENLSTKMQAQFKEAKNLDQEVCFLHAIYPRGDFDPGKADGANMPWASVYVDASEKKTVRVSGYAEKPFYASRYLKWGDFVYGWSPSWIALPDSRQLNFLEKQMDALAEVTAFPRILLPHGYEGTVSLKANGVTYYDPNSSGKPEEWLTAGRYDVGKDRAEIKRKSIEDAFHVDLFQMFAQLQKQMTAREVQERASEKLIQFSPTFSRMTTELFSPMLQRVFAILARAGVLPPPPKEAIMPTPFGPVLPDPHIIFSSRIALAIKSLENQSFFRSFEGLMPLFQLRPEMLDNYDLDEIARDIPRNDGLPARWLKEIDEVAKIRAGRAEAQAKQEQMMQMQAGADAAAKIGSVPADSPAVKALTGELKQE